MCKTPHILGIAAIISTFFIGIACTCDPLPPDMEEHELGRYNRINQVDIIAFDSVSFSENRITAVVTKAYKGAEKGDTLYSYSFRNSSCGLWPKVGESWILCTYLEQNNFIAHLCSRSSKTNSLQGGFAIEFLDSYYYPKDK
ncbi:hypothetical protein GYB22_01365 [bacterium]|nr:hypothetical protein [bacterium]